MATIALELVPPFLAVAELGSFSAAATRLGMEKSSVSRAVARLEDTVGARLFLRTTRRVALTEAGQAVCDRLRGPYASLDAAAREVLDTASSPRGRIAVTAPPDFADAVLADMLALFVRRHPQVEVDLHLSGQVVDLVANKLDAAVRFAPKRLKDSALRARKLASPEIGLFAARSHVEARGTPETLEEAANHTWVALRSIREFPAIGPDGPTVLELKARVTCDEMSFVHHALLRGVGIGLIPVYLAETDLRAGRLVQLLPRWSFPCVGMWFVTHAATKPSRATAAFLECLTEVLASRPSAFRPA
jgi:DNA-binding transcriptional LysR family regulator